MKNHSEIGRAETTSHPSPLSAPAPREPLRSSWPKALVADDQPDVLEAIRLLLKSAGFQTETVTSPTAVLEALRRGLFDVLLMDLNYARDTTSGQEGLNILTMIREIDPTLPIIVMTAWGTVDLAVEAMRRGVQDFVQKPWENERLLTTLRTQIQLGKSLRKAQRLEAELSALSRKTQMVHNRQTLWEIVAVQLRRALQSAAVMIFAGARHEIGFAVAASACLAENPPLPMRPNIDAFLRNWKWNEADGGDGATSKTTPTTVFELDGSLLAPIRFDGEVISIIQIEPKATESKFDDEDRRFLLRAAAEIESGLSHLRWHEQEQEFEEAKAILERLIPKAPPQLEGFEMVGTWKPARAVGGDYYDVLQLDDHRAALCIADVAGKGMPAALLMSNMQAAFQAFAPDSLAPRELCAKVNRVICGHMTEDKFITFFYGALDRRTRRLSYTNAGHNAPLLLRRDGSTQWLDKGGAVFGVFREERYEQAEVVLQPGDWLILFTDGVVEAQNAQGEEFGEARLIEVVQQNRSLHADAMQQTIMQTIEAFTRGEFQDDATLLVLKVQEERCEV